MVLKKLKISGFKSFSKKLELEFGGGITAIVGPNGCGKSNIVDSIRWVLGEQSARTLRGQEMEDVIFSGTSTRKPVGMADVSLTISNTKNILPVDYSEVEVGRRVYRSGESEYSLNRNNCRLKDVRDLFMDTGMGVQAYSIIERDMVEAILSDSGGSRRFLMDEASGIMKYKVRRKEALGKLQLTEHDIVRVNDITGELEKEVRSLRRQVGKARRYKRLEEELRRIGIALSLMRIKRLNLREDELCLEDENEKGKRDTLGASLLKAEAECEELKLAALQGETELRRLQLELNDRLRELEEIVREIMVLDARKEGILARLEEGTKTREKIAAQLEEIRIESEGLEKDSLEVEAALAKEALELKELEAILAEVDSMLFTRKNIAEEAQKKVLESFQATVQKRGELEGCSSRITALSGDIARLSDERALLLGQSENMKSSQLDLAGEVESRRRTAEDLRAKIDSSKERVLEIDERLRIARIEERARAEEYAGIVSRLDTLTELNASFDGFENGVKRLMLESPHHGALGVVANLIDVDHEFIDALETALGNSLQYVVTNGVNDAFSCMDWLSSNKAGKVTFLPAETLSSTRTANVPESILREEGVLGTAADKVKISSELSGILNFLLNGVVIVRDRETAVRVGMLGDAEGLNFVTLDGESVSARGQISGGGKLEGFLRREDELKRLAGAKELCTRALAAMRTKILEEETSKGKLASELNEFEFSLAVEKESLVDAEKKHQDATTRLEHIRAKIEEVTAEHKTHEDELVRLEAACSILRNELLDAETRSSEDDALLSRALLDVKEIDLKKEEVLKAVGEKKMSWVKIASRSKEIVSSIERIERLRDGLKKEQEYGESEKTELETSLSEIEKRGGELLLGREEARGEKDKCEGLVSEVETAHKYTQASVSAKESEVKSFRAEADALTKRVHSIELNLLEVRTEKKSLKETAFSEFGIDLASPGEMPIFTAIEPVRESGDEEYDEGGEPGVAVGSGDNGDAGVTTDTAGGPPTGEMTEEALAEQHEYLKNRFRALGPVNLLAVDEFEEKKTRLDFLNTQRADLAEAREKLLECIATINATARTLFMETFEQAAKNFSKVFTTLFVGGHAELILVGEDPIEASIEIVARPRGKILQRLDLLSGGEKALTAIAFLMGLYLVKSSPFCILDEVDAPLDDANIDRFTSLLKSFSVETQFIVITHNKKTMEIADRLYGVTMEEPGISTVVSVQFNGKDVEKKAARESIREAQPVS